MTRSFLPGCDTEQAGQDRSGRCALATFEIHSVDYAPDELHEQVPFSARLLRQLAGPDRDDYWLASLDQPLSWRNTDAEDTLIRYLVICSRYEGTSILKTMKDLAVGIAYVTDESVLRDSTLDLAKCRYVAIGKASGLDVA